MSQEENQRERDHILRKAILSLPYPFCIINVHDYSVDTTNYAASVDMSSGEIKCYSLNHHLSKPCHAVGISCPLIEVKRTKKPVVVEHMHFDGEGRERTYEIHGYPIFDDDGNLVQIIEYSLDISERKRAEEALQETNQLLETLIDSTHVLIAYLDPQFNFIRVNQAYALADEKDKSFFPGKNHFDLYPNEENQKIFERVRETGRPYFAIAKAFEYKDHPERGVTYWDWSLIPLKSSADELTGVLLTLTNVTERVQAEEAIRKERDRARTYLNLAGTLFVAVDTELRITAVNTTTCEILRYDESEMIGKKWFDDFIPERIKGEFEAEFSKLLGSDSEEIRPYEHPVWTKSGAEKIVAWYNTVLRDDSGKVVGALKSGIDVTTLKETEQALKRSQERYALAQMAANIGSWDWDIRTGRLYWSDQIEPMFGFGLGEFEGTYTAFLQAIHPDDRQYVIDSVNGCVERGQDYAIEHRIIWPDGTIRWVAESGDVSRDESGNAVRMYGVVQDITGRKQAQEALKAAHDELEQRVLDRTAEVARVNEQLRMEHEALERKNIALQEVLNQIDAEKKDLKRRIADNIEQSILPTLMRLKESSHPSKTKTFEMLEKDLRDIAAPFIDVLRGKLAKLSPRETEICRMIRGGLTSKEIAASLNSSEQTVLKQRKTIRKKLGISNKLVNLTTFLKSLELRELKKPKR